MKGETKELLESNNNAGALSAWRGGSKRNVAMEAKKRRLIREDDEKRANFPLRNRSERNQVDALCRWCNLPISLRVSPCYSAAIMTKEDGAIAPVTHL